MKQSIILENNRFSKKSRIFASTSHRNPGFPRDSTGKFIVIVCFKYIPFIVGITFSRPLGFVYLVLGRPQWVKNFMLQKNAQKGRWGMRILIENNRLIVDYDPQNNRWSIMSNLQSIWCPIKHPFALKWFHMLYFLPRIIWDVWL